VLVCPGTAATCTYETAHAWFERDGGNPAGGQLRLPTHQEHFQTEWETSGASPGDYTIVVRVVGVELGAHTVSLAPAGTAAAGSVAVGSGVPILFTIPPGALAATLGCLPGSGSIIDCDVVQIPAASGGQARVFDAQGMLASQVSVASGSASEDHILVLEHQSTAPAPPPLLPTADQIPFYVEATAVTASGAPIAYGGAGAQIVLCQPASLDQSIPLPLHHDLEVVKVNGSVLQRLPTTHGAPECALQGPVPNPIMEIAFAERVRSVPQAVWAWIGPQPLGALHGGLNTVTAAFSSFTAVLGPSATASTASASAGGVGQPTSVVVQARTALGMPFALGGDAVRVEVRGANTVNVTASHGGGGQYAATYSAAGPGVDSLYVFFNGQPIGGGPLTVTQTSTSSVAHSLGVVVLSGGAGMPGAQVVLNGPESLRGTTDDQGVFIFKDLPSGTWTVTVESISDGLYVAQPDSHTVVLGASESTEVEVHFQAIPTA